jgi:alkaline phosphatase
MKGESKADLEEFVRNDLVKNGLGILDPKDKEIEAILKFPVYASPVFADMVSRRAQIGWSTHGHSAVDVNIYGSKGTEKLRGQHENTEIGKFLADYLDVDVDEITRLLNEKGDFAVAGGVPTEEQILAAEDHYRPNSRMRDY